MNIIQFKSNDKATPFAPEWDYYIGETNLNDLDGERLDWKVITDYLLEKEKEILNLPKTDKDISDGHTGLGDNSVTSRHGSFNLFDNSKFKNAELEKLKGAILNRYTEFLNKLNIQKPKNLYVQCWYNVMRKGQKIEKHIHSADENSYLGCHVCVQSDNTSTYYINAINQINDPLAHRSKNEEGKITFFSGCLPHYTDTHMSDEERITIAMDLSLIPEDNFIKIKVS